MFHARAGFLDTAFTAILHSRMVRLNSIFSWSSGKGSNASDNGRSWTLSRPQSIMSQSPQRIKVQSNEAPSNEPEEPKAVCASSGECATDQLQENRPLLSKPEHSTKLDAPSSSAAEPLEFPPNSGYSSRRFAGFKTLFRTRTHRRQRLDFDIRKDGDIDDCDPKISASEGAGHVAAKGDQAVVPTQPSGLSNVPPGDEIRKVSDTTEKSVNSSTTNITVCHRPSRRMSMPITVVDPDLVHQSPFDDIHEASRSVTNVSNPFSEQKKGAKSADQSSSGYSGSDNPFSSMHSETGGVSNSSRSSWCCPTLSGFNGWPTPADRRLATDSFNRLACDLYLEPLGANPDEASQYDKAGECCDNEPKTPRQSLTIVGDGIFAVPGDKLERRRDRLLGRIRTMRSTMHIKAEPAVPRARSLRRMNTFTTLSTGPCLMTSLQGKSLETLARIGGFGFLTLPGDFAPTTLNLPVCFVATINYLRSHGQLPSPTFV